MIAVGLMIKRSQFSFLDMTWLLLVLLPLAAFKRDVF